MTNPLDSCGHDPYTPRHASYFPPEQNPQAVRLPPPSSLVNDAHYHQGVPNGREHAFSGHASYRDVYAPVASMPAHRPAPVPTFGYEAHASTPSPDSRRPVDSRGRLSPTHSSTASDRSEDLPDYHRFRQLAGDKKPSPAPGLSSHSTPVHESPSRYLSHTDVQQMRTSQGAQIYSTRLGLSPQANSPVPQTWSPQPEPRAPERMKIADLLSSEQGSGSCRSSKAPQRSLTSTAVASTYRIRIRQQPVAARSCGFGERDRRVIDPPPIIQMSIEDPNASEDEIKARLNRGYSTMHCTIWNEAGDQDLSCMPEDYRTQRRLMGTVVSSPFTGFDENDEYGCFFCFPDLSCRTPGSFRLQFSFVPLDPSSLPGHRIPVVGTVMSDVFTVYNAKDFPGMKASTALTKRLKEQGCLISIKKGNERFRARDDSDSEDDYDEDGNASGSQRRSKRQKNS
ncbi:hypothetical protein F5Y19DRAFT_476204 [Xylariaceae sp. FL1651]|nr:hypothetical protein F5Y19DRAFT_476204 [Xylariaceae sp. FL1651]